MLAEQNTTRKFTRTRKATDNQKLLTLAQVEAELGVPYRTIADLVARGTLRSLRFPGSRRIWIERRAINDLLCNSVTTP